VAYEKHTKFHVFLQQMKKREKEYFLPPCNSIPSMLPTFVQTEFFYCWMAHCAADEVTAAQ
jgi:hypothetical protein